MAEHRFSDPILEAIRHTPHICLAEGLRSATRAISKRYAAHLGGVTGPAQISLLMRLYYVGPTPMAKLARHMETDRTTLTRTVKLLADAGHVEVAVGEDRRARVVRLTDRGFAALVEAVPLWQAAQAELRRDIGDGSWTSLLRETRRLATLDGTA